MNNALKPEDKKKADLVCRLISEGHSLSSACRQDDTPCRALFYQWLAVDAELVDNYARACEFRADKVFDEIFEIADDNQHDIRTNAEGVELLNSDHVQRAKLRIDARKWALSKMMPKKYGDKLEVEAKIFNVTLSGDDADL